MRLMILKKVQLHLSKIVTPCLKRYSRIRYWTQDESRFGLKTITRRRITVKEVKPLVKTQWSFKSFYVYGIVEPLTGEIMIKHYDRVNSSNFQEFLDNFSKKYPHDFHVVQVDNATFHRDQSLVMPDNLMLLYQPPHSPQVNSSEQLWHWAKTEIANKIFTHLEHLKTTIDDLFQSKPKAFFASLTSREFILSALQKIGMASIT